MNKQQAFLLLIILVSGLASLLVVLPFLEYVLAAVIFGYVLYPLHRRLAPRLGPRLSPIVLLAGSVVAVIIPMFYVGLVLYRDLQAIAAGESGLETEEIEARLQPFFDEEVDLAVLTQELGEALIDVLFGSVTQILTLGMEIFLGMLLVIFLVYYVLKDGPSFVRWAVGIAPMDDVVAHRLVHKIDRTTWGVVVGHIFVAILQGVIGGIGLFLVGIPNYVFWTFVMIVLALLPLIGAFLVWGPAAGYLWLIGQEPHAALLFLYGLIVVSMVDNYARPIVIDQSAHLNPGVILVGVFGGVYAIGFVGLFVGPIVFGVLAATLTAFRRDFDALADHTPPPEPLGREGYPWLDGTSGGGTDGGAEADEGSTEGSATDAAPGTSDSNASDDTENADG